MIWIIVPSIFIIISVIISIGAFLDNEEGIGVVFIVLCFISAFVLAGSTAYPTKVDNIVRSTFGRAYYKKITEKEYKQILIDQMKIEIEEMEE